MTARWLLKSPRLVRISQNDESDSTTESARLSRGGAPYIGKLAGSTLTFSSLPLHALLMATPSGTSSAKAARTSNKDSKDVLNTTGILGVQSKNLKAKPRKPTLSLSQIHRHAFQPLSPNSLSAGRHGPTNTTIVETPDEHPDHVSTTPAGFLYTPSLSRDPELEDYFGVLPESQKRDHTVEITSSSKPLLKSTSQLPETTPHTSSQTCPKSFKSAHSPVSPQFLHDASRNTSYNDDSAPALPIAEMGLYFKSGHADTDWSTSGFRPKPRPAGMSRLPKPRKKRKSGSSSASSPATSRRCSSSRESMPNVARSSNLPLDAVLEAELFFRAAKTPEEKVASCVELSNAELKPEVDVNGAAMQPLLDDSIHPPDVTVSEEGRPPMFTPAECG